MHKRTHTHTTEEHFATRTSNDKRCYKKYIEQKKAEAHCEQIQKRKLLNQLDIQ